jgi:PncC family amidohydrolase
MLGSVPGASQFFPGGVIAYTGGLKQNILGVSEDIYNTKGTVSTEMAIAMARGVRELTNTDFGISTTGVTGPASGRSGLPVGTFFLGLSIRDGDDISTEIRVTGDRDENKHGAARALISLLGNHLTK